MKIRERRKFDVTAVVSQSLLFEGIEARTPEEAEGVIEQLLADRDGDSLPGLVLGMDIESVEALPAENDV